MERDSNRKANRSKAVKLAALVTKAVQKGDRHIWRNHDWVFVSDLRCAEHHNDRQRQNHQESVTLIKNLVR